MTKKRATLVLLSMLSLYYARALVMYAETGIWPKTWPAELEELRKQCHTTEVATGIQGKTSTTFISPIAPNLSAHGPRSSKSEPPVHLCRYTQSKILHRVSPVPHRSDLDAPLNVRTH